VAAGALLISEATEAAVRSYTVPKQGVATSNTVVPVRLPPMPGIKYQTPEGWENLPAGAMRAASLRIRGEKDQVADVSAIPLPGFAGSELDNVNRWRSQVGLGPVGEAELTKMVEKVKIAGEEGHLYDIGGQTSGTNAASRVLGAILRREGMVWFFKVTGADALVAANKAKFVEMLKTVQFTAGEERVMQLPASHPPIGEEAGALPPSHPPIGGASPGQTELPPSHPPVGGANEEAARKTASSKWAVPPTWKEEVAGAMQVARFTISGDTGSRAEASVAKIGGDGGGALANVNRWRGQIGLGPIEAAALEKETSTIEAGGIKSLLLDVTSTDKKKRLIAVSVPGGNSTWFYKIMGDEALVGRERDNFIQFVKSAQ